MACCWLRLPACDFCVLDFVIISIGRPRNSSALATLNFLYFLLSSFVVAYQALPFPLWVALGWWWKQQQKANKGANKGEVTTWKTTLFWLLSHQWQLALAKELFMVMSLIFFLSSVFTFWTWKDGKTNDFALRESWQKPTFTEEDRFVKIRAPNCLKKVLLCAKFEYKRAKTNL